MFNHYSGYIPSHTDFSLSRIPNLPSFTTLSDKCSLLILTHPSKLVQWFPNACPKTATFARHSRPGPIHLCSFTFNDLYYYTSSRLVDLFIIPYSQHAWLYFSVLLSGFSYLEFPPLTFCLIQIPTCPLRMIRILPSPCFPLPGTSQIVDLCIC